MVPPLFSANAEYPHPNIRRNLCVPHQTGANRSDLSPPPPLPGNILPHIPQTVATPTSYSSSDWPPCQTSPLPKDHVGREYFSGCHFPPEPAYGCVYIKRRTEAKRWISGLCREAEESHCRVPGRGYLMGGCTHTPRGEYSSQFIYANQYKTTS